MKKSEIAWSSYRLEVLISEGFNTTCPPKRRIECSEQKKKKGHDPGCYDTCRKVKMTVEELL